MGGQDKEIGKIPVGNAAPVFRSTSGSGSRREGAVLAYGGSPIFEGVPVGDGLVGWILQQANTAGVDFVHAVGILGDVACRAPLENDHIQGGSRSDFFGHHQTAPAATDDDYIRGFK